MRQFDTDIVVVGLGAWGASALWRLAERGVDVVRHRTVRPRTRAGLLARRDQVVPGRLPRTS